MRAQQTYAARHRVADPALRVVAVYQDPLTRHWAAELWDRVSSLIDSGGISSRWWCLNELSRECVFDEAVQAAAAADVLLIAVRDSGEFPPLLQAWIEGWVSRRAGRTGAMVAVIGVPGSPDAVFGRAHEYLEAIAHQAGLDFLPRERKLPDESNASSRSSRTNRPADMTAGSVSLGWRLVG